MDREDGQHTAALEDRLDRIEAELAELREILNELNLPRTPGAGTGLAYGHLRAVVNEVAD